MYIADGHSTGTEASAEETTSQEPYAEARKASVMILTHTIYSKMLRTNL